MEKTMKEIMIDIIENFNKSNVIDDNTANEVKKLININTNYMIKSFQKAYEITPVALDDFEVEKYYIDLCNDVLCAIETKGESTKIMAECLKYTEQLINDEKNNQMEKAEAEKEA